MKNKKQHSDKLVATDQKAETDGYLLYPDKEDIYNKSHKEEKVNLEDISKLKELNENDKQGSTNEKDFAEDESGNDLDVPGAELDDEQEAIGSEDEENNYYSLGGENNDYVDDGRD